jgi:hypothetical protein
MRQGSQRSANTGAPSWLSRPPPEIRKLDQPELLDFCGGRTTLDHSFLGLFDELLESGVFANLFVYSVLIAFAHVSRAKHHKAKYASSGKCGREISKLPELCNPRRNRNNVHASFTLLRSPRGISDRGSGCPLLR